MREKNVCNVRVSLDQPETLEVVVVIAEGAHHLLANLRVRRGTSGAQATQRQGLVAARARTSQRTFIQPTITTNSIIVKKGKYMSVLSRSFSEPLAGTGQQARVKRWSGSDAGPGRDTRVWNTWRRAGTPLPPCYLRDDVLPGDETQQKVGVHGNGDHLRVGQRHVDPVVAEKVAAEARDTEAVGRGWLARHGATARRPTAATRHSPAVLV